MSIELKNVSRSFGKHKVISDFSLSIPDGDRVAIVSYSGSGKTTLFRIISGLDKHYVGECNVKGDISLMFQEDRLFPNVSVVSNVLAVADRPRIKALELLDELGLLDAANMMPLDLSGGMRRRVALARALFFDGDNILLDECFTGLDPDTRASVAEVINRKTEGKTLILITHDKEEARLLGCRVLEFKNGFN